MRNLFISLLHRISQRKAGIKGEGELDVEKSFSVCVNVFFFFFFFTEVQTPVTLCSGDCGVFWW